MWRVDWEQFRKNLTIERKAWERYELARDIAVDDYKEAIRTRLEKIERRGYKPGANFKKFKEKERKKLKDRIIKYKAEYLRIVNRRTKPTIGL